jgi:hypothetical protein
MIMRKKTVDGYCLAMFVSLRTRHSFVFLLTDLCLNDWLD